MRELDLTRPTRDEMLAETPISSDDAINGLKVSDEVAPIFADFNEAALPTRPDERWLVMQRDVRYAARRAIHRNSWVPERVRVYYWRMWRMDQELNEME